MPGNECRCDGIGHVENSLLNPFAPVGGGRGIAELEGFVNSGGGARRDEARKCSFQESAKIQFSENVGSTFISGKAYLYSWVAT